MFQWPAPGDAPQVTPLWHPAETPRGLPRRLMYPSRHMGAYTLSVPPRRRRRSSRRLPISRRYWGFGRTWCPLPARITRPLHKALTRATVVEQPRYGLGPLLRGPWLGLRRQPVHRRRFRARRKVGGGVPAPRAPFPTSPHAALPLQPGGPGQVLRRRAALWARLASATQRQVGALRARTPRPPAPGAHPHPRLGPGLRGGLTPPSSVPSLLPQSMTPPLRGSVTPLRVLEVWQRAWIVGLLLRPRSWATRLRF